MLRSRDSRTAGLLALLAAAVMSPAIAGEFLNWDDPFSVVHNAAVQTGDWKRILTEVTLGIWHPMTLASFALERRVLGPEAWHFHLVDVLLHGLVTALGFRFVRALEPERPAVAVAAGLLFAVHPMHVESVAWISERKDLLSSACYLAALRAYQGFCARAARGLPRASLVWMALGLLCKPVLVSLPLVLLAIDHWQGRRDPLRCALEKLPFFALALAAGWRSLETQAPAPDEFFAIYRGSGFARLGAAAEGLAFYTAKLAWPTRLSVYYDRALVDVGSAEWALAIALAAALAVAALRGGGTRNSARLALAFYLIALAPMLKLLPFGGNSTLNDRYVYLPSLGLFLAAALAFDAAALRAPLAARLRWVPLGAACALLAGLTVERCLVFRDSGALWRDVLAKYPETSVALNQVGRHALDVERDPARARGLFERAARARPEAVEPLVNLAELDLEAGDRPRALERLEAALARGPSRVPVMLSTAELLLALGELPRARGLLERAEQLTRAREPRIQFALARLAALEGKPDEARRRLHATLALAPRSGPAYAALAALELRAGHSEIARSHAAAAVLLGETLDPALAAALERSR
jgi:tetratricopeptide (TPR) repeat protein